MLSLSVVIIGAGLGGLVTGIRLASEGCRVRIFEKNEKAGGCLGSMTRNGFLINQGAGLVTAPFLFDQLFESVNRRRIDYFKLVETEPIFQAIFPNGRRFALFSRGDETLSLNRFWDPRDRSALEALSAENDAMLSEIFFDYCGRAVDEKFLSFRNNQWFRRYDLNLTCAAHAKRTFQSTELQQLYGFWPLLAGGDPRNSSHLFRLIPQFMQRWGVSVPIGGMGRIIDSLVQLFVEMGGELNLNVPVHDVQIHHYTIGGNHATGVRLRDGSIQQADVVISDVEALNTFRYMIDSDKTEYQAVKQALEHEPGLSAFVYFIGMNEILQERIPLAGTNILFPNDYESFLDDVFVRKTLPEDPLILFHIPVKTLPEQAPPNHESIMAIVPVSNTINSRVNWAQVSYAYRNLILNRLQTVFQTDIRVNLVSEYFLDPDGFASRLSSYGGAIGSFLPILRRDGQVRFANRAKDIRNMYLVGSGAHPGGSIPGVILGANNTVELIKLDFG